MSTMTLLASLKTLEAKLRLLTPVSNVFHAETIPGCAWARLAVGINGLALMLPKISEPTMAPVNLPNVAVRFNVRPQIEIEGASTLEEIVFVETKSNEASVQRAFLDVVAMLLSSGRYGHAADVRQLIEDFMELFRSLAGTPRNSALGLWGELLTLSEAREKDLLIRAWHSSPNDRFDFSIGDLRFEIKTVIGPRVHHFSFEQIAPLPDVTILIGSVVTTEDSEGPSIADLLDRVVGMTLDPNLKARAIKVAIASLGRDWTSHSELRFNESLAKSSLRWFSASMVPQVGAPPIGVSAVNFISDLQITSPITVDDVDWGDVNRHFM